MAKNWEKTADGEISEWNEALFKMKRLHELQTEINRVKMDLLAKHPMTNQFNYMVWFNSVLALYSEGEAKYGDEEINEIMLLKKVIEDSFKTLPPHKLKARVAYNGKGKYNYVFCAENWEQIKKLIELLERKVKFFNDKHGLSTKNKENMDGRSILR